MTTKQEKINQKISESMREEYKPKLLRLRELASQGERPTRQYRGVEISEATYYRWLEENSQLKRDLAQLLLTFRKDKIIEAARVGAPEIEQRFHANKLTEKEYNEILEADPTFAEEVEMTRKGNLKLFARRNIATDITSNKSISSSWRYLENTDDEMGVQKIKDITNDGLIDDEDKKAINEFHGKLKSNLLKKSMQKAKDDGEI